MKRLARLFTAHPSSVGETYLEHMRSALGFVVGLQLGALACLVHAFLPFLFVTTGSRRVAQLHDRMVVNRTRRKAGADPVSARLADRRA